jgi:pimeloyl-ACP methyl ester carboxylesterase
MAELILVHGSGQNASSWSRVGKLLAARGHKVATPELPKGAPDWGLVDYAAEITRSISSAQAVVVAHSLSGAFLPLVAQIRECAMLVFLAAVVPEPGKSLRQQFTEDPSMFSPAWIEAGSQREDRVAQQTLAREFLFHDCDEETLAWALGTVELMRTERLVTEEAPFAEWPELPAVSIVATEDRTLTPEWGRRISRRVLGREALEVHSGHCPHMSRPEQIVQRLEQLASRSC